MSVILAIDAAWTGHNPSGVAVVKSVGNVWRCVGVAPSYAAFMGLANGAPVDWQHAVGAVPNIQDLLDATRTLAGAPIDIVTIDMPISNVAIIGRREAEHQIGQLFGGQGCSPHSPTPDRPGRIGRDISYTFHACGYEIGDAKCLVGTTKRLIEVYPHPALLSLLNEDYRVPYKVNKSLTYWPNTDIPTRIHNLLQIFGIIIASLENILGQTGIILPNDADITTLAALKPYEDALDALICAWIGICYLEGNATPCGDENAAIWVPDLELQ